MSSNNFDGFEPHKLDKDTLPVVADSAHELRNLATNFRTRLYITRKAPHQLAENLTTLEHLIDHLDSLAYQLMEVSHPARTGLALELKPLDLNDVAHRVIKVYEPDAESRRLKLTFEAAPNLAPVLADEHQIERVVVNLVSNALKYTPTEGSVSVSTAQDTHWVFLKVHDTGIGISPQALPHIFKRHFRSKEAKDMACGTGLGLAIVRQIIEQCGGQIEVNSTVGEGSVFKVFLPILP